MSLQELAPLAAITMVGINIVVLLLKTGNWSGKQYYNVHEIKTELEAFKEHCDSKCMERVEACDKRFKQIEDYAHNVVNHSVRDEMQREVARVELTYARKEMMTTQFESLTHLMNQKFGDVIGRLERIENGKKKREE